MLFLRPADGPTTLWSACRLPPLVSHSLVCGLCMVRHWSAGTWHCNRDVFGTICGAHVQFILVWCQVASVTLLRVGCSQTQSPWARLRCQSLGASVDASCWQGRSPRASALFCNDPTRADFFFSFLLSQVRPRVWHGHRRRHDAPLTQARGHGLGTGSDSQGCLDGRPKRAAGPAGGRTRPTPPGATRAAASTLRGGGAARPPRSAVPGVWRRRPLREPPRAPDHLTGRRRDDLGRGGSGGRCRAPPSPPVHVDRQQSVRLPLPGVTANGGCPGASHHWSMGGGKVDRQNTAGARRKGTAHAGPRRSS